MFADVNDSHKASGRSLNKNKGLGIVGSNFVLWEVRSELDNSAL
ncbi:7490_t:CDS:2 [Gigaspora margarita]|uniref:7490_t:CDS:1 n=1 Tax=Gigaspora margarita TaxID=4874 RepID=A0ABM8VZF1_GIGMA|nr:7490_t:CDS:2 [Gigaspora margarita]